MGNRSFDKRSAKQQLKGKPACQHKNTIVQTNRKGQNYRECENCGAFLGFC